MTPKKKANHRGRRKDQFELPAQVRSWPVTGTRERACRGCKFGDEQPGWPGRAKITPPANSG